MRILILTLAFAAALSAQRTHGTTAAPGSVVDFSAAGKTAPIQVGLTDPVTCDAAVREQFFNATLNVIKVCTAPNTWTVVTGSGEGGGSGDVSGGSNLTVATRLVVVSGAGTVTEAAGCTYDSAAKRLVCEGGFKASASATERGQIIWNELSASGTSQMAIFAPGALEADRCFVFGDDAPSEGEVLKASSTTVNITVDSGLATQKTFSGCRVVNWEPDTGGGGGGAVESVDGRTGEVTLSDIYAALSHDHAGVYSPVGHNHAGTYEPADATLVKSSGSRTETAITVYDGTGKVISSGCKVDGQELVCGDGTVRSRISLPELAANGSNAFHIYGAANMAADGCIVVNGQPTEGQVLQATGTTESVDDLTCRLMVWATVEGGGGGVAGVESVDGRTGVVTLADLYADVSHNHNGVYSPTSHNHDGVYSSASHNHDTLYAALVHNHDGSYEPIDANLVRSTGTRTENAITVYDEDGKLIGSNCTSVAGKLTCGGNGVRGGLVLPEVTGDNDFRIYSAASMSADGCIILSGQPTEGQVLQATSGSLNVDGKTCRVMTWAAVEGGGEGGAVDSVFGRIGVVVAQSGDYSADMVTNAVDKTAGTTYTAGAKQTFQASAATAGINVGCGALPSTPALGDIACGPSGILQHWDGTTWVQLGGQSGTGDIPSNLRAGSIQFYLDGGGSAVPTGRKKCARVEYSGEITGFSIFVDEALIVARSIVVDVVRASSATFPSLASMVGTGNRPTLSNEQFNLGVAVSGWTSTTVNAGDIICPSVVSGDAESVSISLRVLKEVN